MTGRLAEAGHSVLLVEAGGPSHFLQGVPAFATGTAALLVMVEESNTVLAVVEEGNTGVSSVVLFPNCLMGGEEVCYCVSAPLAVLSDEN